MGIFFRLLRWGLGLIVLAVLAAGLWLYLRPPALIQVGTAYAAKIVCSNVYIAERDPQNVLALDVQAPGHPLLKYVRVEVDEEGGTVEASLMGLFARSVAVHRSGLGCVSLPGGDLGQIADIAATGGQAVTDEALWPKGNLAEFSQFAEIDAILDAPDMTGTGMRAVVVVHDGRIVGERYGDAFTAVTPLLGWSMSKTVNAAIIGTLVKEGRLSLEQTGLLAQWQDDRRGEIALSDLMAMSSGLAFNENYGGVSDVTRMLYLEPDMAGFAAGKPLSGAIGETFSYSSGTSVVLSRIWQDAAGGGQMGLEWARKALFDPIGMSSAVLEADAAGTFAGSSYLYANARDWARFGLLLLQRGAWEGRSILPAGFVYWMVSPASASTAPWGEPEYGQGQVWLHGPTAGSRPGADPDAGFDLPDDAFWLLGHDGQSMVVIPSRDLVVLRMGLTPSKLGYKPQPMVEALVGLVDAGVLDAPQD
ncbi:serine hydrolase domain-containing protein [Mesorhizobium xinjiangense]|uniref:serine hydrolase domain-containing protein n=1 Tax=Mesorhizobium xinjiangense TaxID=2678685 RepID=UPI0012ED0704|nr:serine hydrolase [Mesorhizobium xinjiangense]